MSDIAPAHSALACVTPFGSAGCVLALGECPGSTLLHLEGARPGAALDAVVAGLALAHLPKIGGSGGYDGTRLLGLGPDIWMLAHDAASAVPDILAPGGLIGQAFEVTVDVSHAYTRIEIDGDHSVEFIAKACALDLHPRSFAPGACAATGFAGMRTILWRSADADRFELLIGRSYAVSLWEWMIDAAAEYGMAAATAIEAP
jgi:sarcosine oxidase subunit gamma